MGTIRILPSRKPSTLTLLQELIAQVGPEQAAHITVGHIQARLGITKPLAEVRKALKHRMISE